MNPPLQNIPVSGIVYWRDSAPGIRRELGVERTWQSMKEHFRKAIVPHLFSKTEALHTEKHRTIAIDCFKRFTNNWEDRLKEYDNYRKSKK